MEAQDHKQYSHTILPTRTHDEFARQEFVKSLKLHLATSVSPNNRVIYDEVVKPKFEKKLYISTFFFLARSIYII